MKYRRATIVADDWHGEFGSYDEWARLGLQPPYRAATFFDAQGRRCITQLGRGTIGRFHRGIAGRGLSDESAPRLRSVPPFCIEKVAFQ